MKYLEKTVLLIEQLRDNVSYSPLCDPEKAIEEAEKLLGIPLARAHKEYLQFYNSINASFLGIEVYEFTKKNAGIPSFVWATLELRKEGLPKSFVEIAATGYGPHYVIDCMSDEGTIFLFDVEPVLLEKIYDSFDDFLSKHIKNRWKL